jgi:hypothetical protein
MMICYFLSLFLGVSSIHLVVLRVLLCKTFTIIQHYTEKLFHHDYKQLSCFLLYQSRLRKDYLFRLISRAQFYNVFHQVISRPNEYTYLSCIGSIRAVKLHWLYIVLLYNVTDQDISLLVLDSCCPTLRNGLEIFMINVNISTCICIYRPCTHIVFILQCQKAQSNCQIVEKK